jgi:biotin transporter BioY
VGGAGGDSGAAGASGVAGAAGAPVKSSKGGGCSYAPSPKRTGGSGAFFIVASIVVAGVRARRRARANGRL